MNFACVRKPPPKQGCLSGAPAVFFPKYGRLWLKSLWAELHIRNLAGAVHFVQVTLQFHDKNNGNRPTSADCGRCGAPSRARALPQSEPSPIRFLRAPGFSGLLTCGKMNISKDLPRLAAGFPAQKGGSAGRRNHSAVDLGCPMRVRALFWVSGAGLACDA